MSLEVSTKLVTHTIFCKFACRYFSYDQPFPRYSAESERRATVFWSIQTKSKRKQHFPSYILRMVDIKKFLKSNLYKILWSTSFVIISNNIWRIVNEILARNQTYYFCGVWHKIVWDFLVIMLNLKTNAYAIIQLPNFHSEIYPLIHLMWLDYTLNSQKFCFVF